MKSEGYWIRDHKPNRYPTTEQERYEAAIKYGMRPEDYKPYGSLKILDLVTLDF